MRKALGLVLLILAAGGGCGANEGESRPDGGPERLSHEELNREASAVCDRIDDQIDALEEPHSDEEFLQFNTEVIALTERGIAGLKALEPPVADERAYNGMIAAMESALTANRLCKRVSLTGILRGQKTRT